MSSQGNKTGTTFTMDEVLKERRARRVHDPDVTFLDCFVTVIFDPWFETHKKNTKGAQVYTDLRYELDSHKKKTKQSKPNKSEQSTHESNKQKEVDEVKNLHGSGQGGSRPKTPRGSRNQPPISPSPRHQQNKALPVVDDRLKEVQQLIIDNGNYKQKIAQLDQEGRKKDIQIERLHNQLKNEIDKVQDLTLRLSKLAGQKLREGNPDIADLSDKYRPTQLGKDFSELYDNEWSDAYEHIEGDDDDKKIEMLHSIMQASFTYCTRTWDSQIPTIQAQLLEEDPDGKSTLGKDVNLHNLLKDIRKKLSPTAAENVAKSFVEDHLKELSGFSTPPESLGKFAYDCTRLSWLMLACDPQMNLTECKPGDRFESDVYKAYTKSDKGMKNPVVDFAVWPALRLHVNGPLVARGVAQPIEEGSEDKQNGKSASAKGHPEKT